MHSSSTPSSPNRSPRRVGGYALAFVGAIAITLGATGTTVAGIQDIQNLPLHNVDAGSSSAGCPDTVNDYWHFVITPNNGKYAFVTINLDIGGSMQSFSGSAIVPNGGQHDNVFVEVPADASYSELNDGDADITPSGDYQKFVLSHVCHGTGYTTTTTPTTTPTSVPCEDDPYCNETTTTVPEETTTTTVPEETTTTTVPEETTTTSIPEETTTTVPEATTTTTDATTTTTTTTASSIPDEPTTTVQSSSGPTTSLAAYPPIRVEAAGTPTTVVAQLPRTGSDGTKSFAVVGALLVLLGGALLIGTRRTLPID